MAEQKEDRRIRRTKRMLKRGLALMMAEKNFKDITVKDITDKVDLNRSTFYLHYKDTYDLLEKLENDTLDDFQTMIEANRPATPSESLKPIFESIIDYIIENSETCRLIFENKASGDFFSKFKKLIELNGSIIVKQKYPAFNSENIDYFFGFITYGTIGLFKQWFVDGMAMDRNDIVSFADKIVNSAAQCLN